MKMKTKTALLILCTILISIPAFTQIDNNSGFGTPINAQESTNSFNDPLRTNAPRSLSNNNSFLNTTENKPKLLTTEEEKEFNMTTDNGLMTRKFDYKPSWLTKDAEIKSEFGKTQLLGTYGTNSKTIEVLCRDHQYVDGDRVRIIVNDQVVVHNINLRADFQSFLIDLKEGRNVIEFEALNQGTSGPNTAHFRVFDENDNLITENVWNLLTGVRATLVVIQGE
jgi:hypothetical protein